jgi:hypothetical protein
MKIAQPIIYEIMRESSTLLIFRGALKGLAGSRWMPNDMDQAMLRDASVIAARSQAPNPDGQEQPTKIANSISLTCSPSHLLRMMQALPNVGAGRNL